MNGQGIMALLRRRALAFQSLAVRLFGGLASRRRRRAQSRYAQANTLVNLFAAIITRRGTSDEAEVDTAFDLLRYSFPNVEHSWLASRFDRALRAHYNLNDTLAVAASGRSEGELFSIALQVLSLLHQTGAWHSEPDLFGEITLGLLLPGASEKLARLVGTPGLPAEAPVESVSFSSARGEADVDLESGKRETRFRVLRCEKQILVLNDAPFPIDVRGRSLKGGEMLPLASGQVVSTPAGVVSFELMEFYLRVKRSGVKVLLYLHLENGSLQISRRRVPGSELRLKIGLGCEMEVLRHDAECVVDGDAVSQGAARHLSLFDSFSLQGEGPFVIADIRQASHNGGNSFMLDPGIRKIRVTNLPDRAGPHDLVLAAGKAPGCVFEVQFTRGGRSGVLHVLEGSGTLTVRDETVKEDVVLHEGELIRLSAHQALRCRFSAGVLDEESGSIVTLSVEGLAKSYLRTGSVLDNIDFTAHRGEMTCILGPSGSGKSTLLALLAGHLQPTRGRIRYNGLLLARHNEELRRHIAYIPREDILDEAMTVIEHIHQASIVRRPRLSRADRRRRVLAILNYIGLGHLASRHVGRMGERIISDGERTRLNLGLDLTGTADVFLVDEPISGLSSGDADRVIDTLENMMQDKVVVVTMHRPSAALLKRFHKVLVLDHSGRVAYWGDPERMMPYFKQAAKELGVSISANSRRVGGADYVFEVLEAPLQWHDLRRRQNPRFWQERYEAFLYRRTAGMPENRAPAASLVTRETMPVAELPPYTPRELWRLFSLWAVRTFLGRVRSRMGLYTMLLEGPVLALLISFTLRAASDTPYTLYKALHINEYMFLSVVLAMFFGLTGSASEILKDRPVLRRESNYRPFVTGYVLAKAVVLTGIASLQCALYLLAGNAVLGIHYMFWDHLLVMTLTAFVGISLSLMVSALVRSERVALNVVPLLLVPQILLAGALIRFEEMNDPIPQPIARVVPDWAESGLARLRHRVPYQDERTHDIKSKPVPAIAELCPLRYAFEMMFVGQTSENLWELEARRIDERREELKEHGTAEQLRFIQDCVLALNGSAPNADEARRRLRSIRRAALEEDPARLADVMKQIDRDEKREEPSMEFIFTNKKLTAVREGIKSARKDDRLNESRGFFLAPRQPRPFSEQDHRTDGGSISTLLRDGVYLCLMGIAPLLIVHRRVRFIVRGDKRRE